MSETSESFHTDVAVSHNYELHRYELTVAGTLAVFADYTDAPGHVDFIHTETLPGYQGAGLAKVLVRYALDDVVASGKRIVPSCPFVASFVQQHPAEFAQYADAAGA